MASYDLNCLKLCPRHLAAVDSLLAYNILSPFGPSRPIVPLAPISSSLSLPDTTQRGLVELDRCLRYLHSHWSPNRDPGSSCEPTDWMDRGVLRLRQTDSGMLACLKAAGIFNLLFSGNGTAGRYDILNLFVAYLFRNQAPPYGQSVVSIGMYSQWRGKTSSIWWWFTLHQSFDWNSDTEVNRLWVGLILMCLLLLDLISSFPLLVPLRAVSNVAGVRVERAGRQRANGTTQNGRG